MLLDYASTLRAGQSLVPDFRLQAMQDEQFGFQREQMQMQREQMERQRAAEERAQQQAEAFQRDMTQVMSNGGNPSDITGLMFRYPQQFEQHKAAFDRLEADQQKAELTQMGSIYSRLSNDDPQGAAAMLRQRVDADRAAGQEDPIDEALLKALESGDPREIAIAKTMIGTQVAALGGVDTFKAVYGGNDDRTAFQKDWDFFGRVYGQKAADQFAQAEYDPTVVGQPGAPIYRQSQISGTAPAPLNMRGGDPSGSGGLVATREQEAESADVAQRLGLPFEGASFDQAGQQYGAPRDGRTHNGLDFSGRLGTPIMPVLAGTVVDIGEDGRSGRFVKVRHRDGRVSSYAHLGDVSVSRGQDVGAGTPLGTLGRTGNVRAGEGRGVLHFVMRDQNGKPVDPAPLFGGPVRVRSVQEARALPPGTEFVTPDGRRMRR